jgi:type I restriction enzyme, R subunit
VPHAYTEDQLVEQPAIGLFAELGWQTVSAMEETFGATGTLLRETKGEVVLVSRLRAALVRLNSALPPEVITAAVDELTRDRLAMGLEAANREVYLLLKEGIKVSVPDKERGGQKTERLRVIDWEYPANNDFLLVSQFSVTGALYTCRPDLVGFVNGLPLMVIELKKPGVPARVAFDENLTHYKQQIPSLFWFNALLIASNGTDSRVGSLTADWERFFEWKRIERESEPRRVSLEVMIRGTCDRTRLLDLVENFTLFSEHKAGLVKIIGQNHQFLGVNNAIVSMLAARKLGHGRGGVFWQTQGSGKSFSMVFFAQKVLRKVAGNWTFVVVTDRVELDDQIAKTFKATGAVSEAEGDQCHAASGAHLIEGVARPMQQNDHGPVLPLPAAAVKTSMNDIVFREIARSGRGKAKVSMPVEFNLCRLTVRRNKTRSLQKFDCFLQPPVIWLGRHHQCRRLNGRPVHQFCQWRDHVLFFRPVSNLGASQ